MTSFVFRLRTKSPSIRAPPSLFFSMRMLIGVVLGRAPRPVPSISVAVRWGIIFSSTEAAKRGAEPPGIASVDPKTRPTLLVTWLSMTTMGRRPPSLITARLAAVHLRIALRSWRACRAIRSWSMSASISFSGDMKAMQSSTMTSTPE